MGERAILFNTLLSSADVIFIILISPQRFYPWKAPLSSLPFWMNQISLQLLKMSNNKSEAKKKKKKTLQIDKNSDHITHAMFNSRSSLARFLEIDWFETQIADYLAFELILLLLLCAKFVWQFLKRVAQWMLFMKTVIIHCKPSGYRRHRLEKYSCAKLTWNETFCGFFPSLKYAQTKNQ